MHSHHTKDKGDLGVAKAFADLVSRGYTVLFPATEHAPFDLVTYRDGTFCRVQVKFRAARDGTVKVPFKSFWADRHGSHVRRIDKSAIDIVCLYCPDTDECYYLRPQEYGLSVTLRLTPSRNGQTVGVLQAADYRLVPEAASSAPM